MGSTSSIPPLFVASGQIVLHATGRLPLTAAAYGNAWLQWISIAIRLLLGIVLVIGAEGIYGAIRRFRLGFSSSGETGEKDNR